MKLSSNTSSNSLLHSTQNCDRIFSKENKQTSVRRLSQM
nr:MAG TPA: hypothetical protein [Caudoviricetes sp.]